jgi:hypothetical protein
MSTINTLSTTLYPRFCAQKITLPAPEPQNKPASKPKPTPE